MSKHKSIPWKKACLTVGCIATRKGLVALTQATPEADIIEVRYDVLRSEGLSPEELISHLEKRRVPVLLTLRTTREGGSYPWKSRERMLAFEALLPYVDAVDIELQNLSLVKPVVTEARRQKVAVIFSIHSLQRKVTLGRAKRWVAQFRKHRARVYKIATLARNRKDLGVLAQILLEHPELRLGVMAVGPMAALSRRVLPALGSRLAYGYLDQPTAKGQPSLKEVAGYLK